MSFSARLAFAVFLAALSGCDVGSGQQSTRLESEGLASGFQVAISGPTAFVTSSGNGPVAVYERGPEGWTRSADLLPDGVGIGFEARDQYGWAVDVDGDVAVVGAYGYDGGRGAAFVFEREGPSWSLAARLKPPGLARDGGPFASDGSHFGGAVAVGGGQVFVSRVDKRADAVYVYSRGGGAWTLDQTIEAPDRAGEAFFGSHLGTDGRRLVVRSGEVPPEGLDPVVRGVVRVYRQAGTGWELEARLTSDAPYEALGEGGRGGLRSDGAGPVDIDGDVLVSGAAGISPGGVPSVGAVFVYEFADGAWRQTARLIPDDADAYDYVGLRSVAVEKDLIIAPSDFKGATGAVYTFERAGATWTQADKLVEHDTPASQAFGISVDLDGGTLLVGAPYEDGEDGAAYVYRWSGSGWAR